MLTSSKDVNQAVMAVGAHADDIEIQVGGTLEKYFHMGYSIIYVMSTNNMSGMVSTMDASGRKVSIREPVTQMMARRKRECDDAARQWNTTPIHLDHPQRHYTNDQHQQVQVRYGSPLPAVVSQSVPSILTACEDAASIERLKNLILEKNPEVIFTHGLNQSNPEHFCTALLVANSYWAAVREGYRGALLLWLEQHTLFGPASLRWDTYVDYTPWLDRKMELIGKHACQMPNAMDPEFGLKVLARDFGKMAGCGAAELFTWVNRSTFVDAQGPLYGSMMMELLNHSRS